MMREFECTESTGPFKKKRQDLAKRRCGYPRAGKRRAAVTQEHNGTRRPMHRCHMWHTRLQTLTYEKKNDPPSSQNSTAEPRQSSKTTFRANCTPELHTHARSFASITSVADKKFSSQGSKVGAENRRRSVHKISPLWITNFEKTRFRKLKKKQTRRSSSKGGHGPNGRHAHACAPSPAPLSPLTLLSASSLSARKDASSGGVCSPAVLLISSSATKH